MPNVGEVIAALKAFAIFCLEYPWLSIPLAAVLLILAVAGGRKIVKEVQAEIAWAYKVVKDGPNPKRAWLGLGLCGLGLTAWGISAVARYEVRPRPITERVPRKVIRPDFTIRWNYESAMDPSEVKFRVSVRNHKTGRVLDKETSLRYLTFTDTSGPLSISVRAVENGSPGPAGPTIDLDYYRDSTERIAATGQIVAAVHTDRSDGLFCYEAGESYQGFDIDLLKALADKLTTAYKARGLYPKDAPRLSVKAVRFGWPEILDEPARMEAVDLAIASISYTEQREKEKRIYFSKPYWETKLAAVHAGAITSPFALEELRGKRIGVHQDTTALAFIKSQVGKYTIEKEIVKAVDNADLFSKLRNGLIDIALYDYDRAVPEVKANPGWTARVIEGGQREQYGIIVARINTGLRDDLNAALDALKPQIQAMMERRLGIVSPAPGTGGTAASPPAASSAVHAGAVP